MLCRARGVGCEAIEMRVPENKPKSPEHFSNTSVLTPSCFCIYLYLVHTIKTQVLRATISHFPFHPANASSIPTVHSRATNKNSANASLWSEKQRHNMYLSASRQATLSIYGHDFCTSFQRANLHQNTPRSLGTLSCDKSGDNSWYADSNNKRAHLLLQ